MNKTIRAKLTALGTYVPPRILDNQQLEKMVETTNQWILERTGISERHIVDKGVAASDLAAEACRDMVARYGTDLSNVDGIVVGTVIADMHYPSTACLVQHKLNIPNVWGYDLSAGCSGFVYALTAGVHMIESGRHKKVLVIGSDVNSCMTDYTDRNTCVLFGDGAGAVLVEPCRDDEEPGFIDYVHLCEGFGGKFLNMPGGGSLHPSTHETVDKKMHFIYQDGKQVFKYAVTKMAEMTERVLAKNNLTGADVDCFIAHQANKRIITATADRLKMPYEKVIINIEKYCNTTAGTIPLGMRTAIDEGKLKKGNLLLIAAVGAGYTSGASLIRWKF